jgi:hypothetical protein
MTGDLDLEAAYRVDEYAGVAWRLLGYELVRDEDYEWSGIEYENRDRVRAHMVGDDRVFTFEVSQLRLLGEDEFCPECGQIGCTAVPR